MAYPALILLFFFSLFLMSLSKSRHLESKCLAHFRALFPSWRFFDDIAPELIFEVRTKTGSSEFGNWEPAIYKPPIRLSQVLFNPNGNLYLAKISLLEQVEQEISEVKGSEIDQFSSTVAYKLCRNLAEFHLRESKQLPCEFQFRLSRADELIGVFLSSQTERA